MRGITFQIILFLLIKSIQCKKTKPVDVTFLKMSIDRNPKHLEYCEMNITPRSNARSFNLRAHLLTNITKDLIVNLQFFMKNNLEDEYNGFFSYEFDMCRLMQGFMSQTVARFWAQNLKKFSNIPLSCPVLQNHYYIKNMKIDRKSIPMMAVNGIYMVKSKLFLRNKNQMELVGNSTIEVEIRL